MPSAAGKEDRDTWRLQSSYRRQTQDSFMAATATRRSSSNLPNLTAKVLEQRYKMGNSVHIFVVLATLATMFSLSAFLMAPQSQHMKPTHLQPPADPPMSQAASKTAVHAAAAKAAAAQAAAVAKEIAPAAVDLCHTEAGAEYSGEDVIEWGSNHLKDTASECCAACQAAQQRGCNIWVWCGEAAGCGERKHKECWLKRQREMRLTRIAGARGTNFTSGALYDDAKRSALIAAEAARLSALQADESLPLVYFDVAIKGKHIGRIHFVLFTKDAPRAAENFRQLCTGERGTVPTGHTGAGSAYHLKGKSFYRIIDGFIDQAGANTDSVFGGQFKDDPGGLALKHDRKGLLSMANTGPDTNDSHFSIVVEAAPHLNGKYTIFGEAVDGFEVIDAINALARGKKDNTASAEDGAVITDSGQIRKGTYKPNLEQ